MNIILCSGYFFLKKGHSLAEVQTGIQTVTDTDVTIQSWFLQFS